MNPKAKTHPIQPTASDPRRRVEAFSPGSKLLVHPQPHLLDPRRRVPAFSPGSKTLGKAHPASDPRSRVAAAHKTHPIKPTHLHPDPRRRVPAFSPGSQTLGKAHPASDPRSRVAAAHKTHPIKPTHLHPDPRRRVPAFSPGSQTLGQPTAHPTREAGSQPHTKPTQSSQPANPASRSRIAPFHGRPNPNQSSPQPASDPRRRVEAFSPGSQTLGKPHPHPPPDADQPPTRNTHSSP